MIDRFNGNKMNTRGNKFGLKILKRSSALEIINVIFQSDKLQLSIENEESSFTFSRFTSRIVVHDSWTG